MSRTEGRPTVAITGVTGAVGGQVARDLAAAGVPLRLLARSPHRAPRLPGSVVEAVTYGDASTARAALDGVETLLMVSAAESADRLEQHLTFVDAAAQAGVRHIVYTSFAGAAPDAVFTLARDHYATEQRIAASGTSYTFLRDNLYLDFFHAMVGDDDVIRGPAGTGRVAGVTRRDVARAATVALQTPDSHAGRTYELTGPEALTMADVAHTIAAATGRPVRYHEETVAEAYRSRLRWEAPLWQYDAWVSTYTAIAAGQLERVTSDVEALTGAGPLSLAQLLASARGTGHVAPGGR